MNPERFRIFRLSRWCLWSLLTGAGVFVSISTLLGFWGRYSWFLDLFSHFRVQYLVSLSLIGVLFLAGSRRWRAVVFFAFALINFLLIAPFYLGRQDVAPGNARVMRAMMINVNTHYGDPHRVRQVIQEVDSDVLVLEEISSRWMNDLDCLESAYPHSHLQTRDDNFGIGLFSKFPFMESEIVYVGEAAVPTIIATLDNGREPFCIIATHPPPPFGATYSRWRNDQLEQLPDYISSELPVLLLGDLNMTPWSYHFRKLIKRSGLRDSSRGCGIQPTWPSFNPLFFIPIDYCLHSPDIVVLSKVIGDDIGSDHYPVIVDFAIINEPEDSAENML